MKKIIVLIMLLVTWNLYAQLATNAAWPMFRQNVRHTGWTNKNVLGVQKNPLLKWAYTTGAGIYSSPAIGADGTVYVGSRDNKLYAITNGAVKWSYNTATLIYSSPAIGADGTVYVGSWDNKLYAITNGAVKWSYATGGHIDSSPAIGADGTVYVGSKDNKLYAITNGAVKWSYTTGSNIDSSPAIGADGTVYVGSEDNKLYAITNGAVKWSYTTGGDIDSSPAIGADGTVYVGSYDNKLYAITNGALKWSYTTGGDIEFSSPAIGADGTVYVGSKDDKLYAITNGAVKWSYATGGDIYSSPAIGADGTVYVGSEDNKLYAITNGAVKWSYTTGAPIYYSSPAISADGTVYVGSDDRRLYAIQMYTGPFYVDDNSSNAGNNGSFSAPFDTIQHAADVMSAGLPTCTASTTYIFPGNYAQSVEIRLNKNHGYMVFTALSNTKPHFTGGLWAFSYVTNTSRVIFKNLYISNYSAVGIYLNNSRSNVCISNRIVHVSGGGWAGGIGIFNNSDNNRIIGNVMHDNERSIKLDGSLTRFNTISNNTIYNDTSDAGIYLRDACRSNYIYDNTIRGCTNDGGGGIYFESAYQNIFKGNTIWSNSIGMYFYGDSKGNSIVSNVIFSNISCAIYLRNATNTLIQGNTVGKEHGGRGAIYLELPAYNNIIRDNIISNSSNSLTVKGDKNIITGNSIHNIQCEGINVFDGDNTLIQSNRIFACHSSGIYLCPMFDTVTNTLILHNHIYSNVNGIQFYLVKRNTCTSNLIYENSHDGIVFNTSTNNLFYGNKIKKNGNNGLTCENSSYSNRIAQNTIISNTANNGILIWNSQKSEIVSNILAYNAFGFHIYSGSSKTKGERNAVYRNNGHGIVIDNSTSSILWHNSIVSNGVFTTYHGVIIANSAVDNELVNNIIAGTKTGYGVSWDGTGSGNILKYNNFYDNNSGATDNMTKGSGSHLSDPKLKGFDIYSTNFLTLSSNVFCVDSGTNLGYSYIGIAPDMGWKESVFVGSKLSITKSVSNIMSPLGNKPIPGAKIIYKLCYADLGIVQNLCIYDHLPSNVTFFTSYFTSVVTGWTLQYSTNSSDYTTTAPVDKTTIKWIRWKKSTISINETGIIYYAAIIK